VYVSGDYRLLLCGQVRTRKSRPGPEKLSSTHSTHTG